MAEPKKTKLYDAHIRHGGRIIDYAGWALPVQFEGITIEHETVRKAAGIFDVSHMGEIEVKGKDAEAYIQYLVTNDISKLKDNQVAYTLMCYPDGGVVDDLLVYRFSEDEYLLVVNAANTEKDFQWMKDNLKSYDVEIKNISEYVGQIALQGPKSEEILQRVVDIDLKAIKSFYFERDVDVAGTKCLISRTGYTGEDGFEIYTDNENIEKIWEKLLETGKDFGLKPIGLGARDTLRFEAGLPLYGNEISQDITPLEAGLGFFVKFDKPDYIGKEALLRQKEEGLKRKLVGFEMLENGIPRHGYEVISGDRVIGFVTTGYYSPTFKKNIGLAIVDAEYSELGTPIEIKIRKKILKAKVVNKRFYKK